MFNGKIHYKWPFSIAMFDITRGCQSVSTQRSWGSGVNMAAERFSCSCKRLGATTSRPVSRPRVFEAGPLWASPMGVSENGEYLLGKLWESIGTMKMVSSHHFPYFFCHFNRENDENPLGNSVGVLYFQTNSPNLIWNISKSTKWRSVNLEKTWKTFHLMSIRFF